MTSETETTEAEREALTGIIRWHAIAAGAHREDSYLSLGVENTLNQVERIVAEQTQALEAEVEREHERTAHWRQIAEAAESEVQRLRQGIEAIADAPDGTAWVEVEPYMDPPNEDECVEVRFVDVDRLRALLRDGEA